MGVGKKRGRRERRERASGKRIIDALCYRRKNARPRTAMAANLLVYWKKAGELH